MSHQKHPEQNNPWIKRVKICEYKTRRHDFVLHNYQLNTLAKLSFLHFHSILSTAQQHSKRVIANDLAYPAHGMLEEEFLSLIPINGFFH